MTGSKQQQEKFCVIGAGSSGLAAAKTFKERGIPFDCIEREEEIGGLWNAGTDSGVVYKTCHMVSSKEFTSFDDFPFPEDYPAYPSHAEALHYLKSYAEHFGIMDDIELGKTVESVQPANGAWEVKIEGEKKPRLYRGVVLANGHHDEPRMPSYPGKFTGEMMHSRAYKGPENLAGKRVLLVGAGNSGCDIAVDGVHHAKSIIHSMRRGYYFVPKFTFGLPTDDVVDFAERCRLPRWLKQRIYWLTNLALVGPATRHGLPKPEHHILDTHPTISSEIPGYVAHGRIKIKPDVERFSGRKVFFNDGSDADVDVVIFATGYRMTFPFIDERIILDEDGRPKLFLNVFHPQRDDIFAVGLVQANGSIWRLADYQSRLIANYLVALQSAPAKAKWFRSKKSAGAVPIAGRGKFVASERHKLEHDYYEYRRALKSLLRRFGRLRKVNYKASAPAPREKPAPVAVRPPKRMRAA